MKHYVRLSMTYSATNKAKTEAVEMIREYDGVLLYSNSELDDFRNELKKKIDKINRANSRCKDLIISSYKHNIRGKVDPLTINCEDVFIVDVHPVLKELI